MLCEFRALGIGKKLLYGAAVGSKLEPTRMHAKRHVSDLCRMAGSVELGFSSLRIFHAIHLVAPCPFPFVCRFEHSTRKVS